MMTDAVSIGKTHLYPIPENWHWTHLKEVVSISKEKTDTFADRNIKYVGLEHMEKDAGIISSGSPVEIKSTKNIFHTGQVLYGKLRPYLNKHDVAKFDGVCSTDILVLNVFPIAIPSFVDLFLNQRDFIEYAVSNSKGINLPRVSGKEVLEAVFPLPPLPEQQRIVDRIESLFAKLDEAKEKAQVVVDGFEDRKAAILHKAFTGELTSKWRKTNEVSTWETCFLHEICLSMRAGGDKPDDFSLNSDEQHSFPVVANGIDNDGIIGYSGRKAFDNAVTVSGRGTIGYSLYRPYPFFPVVRLLTLVPGSRINPEFMKYAFDAFPEKGTGSSIPQLTVPMIKDKKIPVPSLEEQRQIVEEIKKTLDLLEQVKEKAETVISQIDTMKKAILARAFRGELGTNDPSELPVAIGE